MIPTNETRQHGFTFITVIGLVTFLVTVAAALGALGTNILRSASRSDEWMRAFYLADSGVQVGNAELRASGGDLPYTQLYEHIAGETAYVEIEPTSPNMYSVRSSGTVSGEEVNIEILVEFIPNSLLEGGMHINISNGVEVRSDEIPVRLVGTVGMSGMNHDASGTPLVDTSGSIHAFALNPVPGETGVDVEIDVASTPNVTVEGMPEAITNAAGNISSTVQNLRSEAQSDADVFVVGTTTLGSGDSGSYGTAADPAIVYVNLGDDENLKLQGSFEGHGTLFIDVGKVNDTSVLTMAGTASWQGLIVVYFRDEVTVDKKDLIEILGTNDIVGGMVTSFGGSFVDFTGKGKLLYANGNVNLLYSSDLVGASPGLETVIERNAKLASYRVYGGTQGTEGGEEDD